MENFIFLMLPQYKVYLSSIKIQLVAMLLDFRKQCRGCGREILEYWARFGLLFKVGMAALSN